MRRLALIALFGLFTLVAEAQELKLPAVDASPADIVYYPLNAAKVKDGSMPLLRVIYSRPTRKGRDIFGILEQYGKVWRAGANENTEIKFFKTALIGGKKIKAGSYSLFAIPGQEEWTIIINKQTDRWGAFTYDQSKDVVRVKVPVKSVKEPVETLSMTFRTEPKGVNLVIAWDKVWVELPVAIN
ncbi:hypothetical protein PBAL39_11767 [Pedobacter sp. BAL39]|uniref:DUF2911 domain-containing protein n=1 Tax=Pedobacter sp. BAL39 TaxID=391596 RepID=UPI0001559BFD|nr:DUF2911 domain-containing protein [Pedobacter sp. BAL39]EDM36380.1 hypothetical protein PBAL39_11767 [Pedobacter sp. BAL39]